MHQLSKPSTVWGDFLVVAQLSNVVGEIWMVTRLKTKYTGYCCDLVWVDIDES